MANMRNDQRQYGTNQGDDEETPGAYKKRKNMRGRKGKYYSQVDDEDQTFLDQERRLIAGITEDEDEEEDKLHSIEEESLNSTRKDDDKTKLLNKGGKPGAKPSPKGQITSPKDQKALEDKILRESNTSPKGKAGAKKVGAIPETAEEHEDEPVTNKNAKGGKQSTSSVPSKDVKKSQEALKKS